MSEHGRRGVAAGQRGIVRHTPEPRDECANKQRKTDP